MPWHRTLTCPQRPEIAGVKGRTPTSEASLPLTPAVSGRFAALCARAISREQTRVISRERLSLGCQVDEALRFERVHDLPALVGRERARLWSAYRRRSGLGRRRVPVQRGARDVEGHGGLRDAEGLRGFGADLDQSSSSHGGLGGVSS